MRVGKIILGEVSGESSTYAIIDLRTKGIEGSLTNSQIISLLREYMNQTFTNNETGERSTLVP